jgi:chromosome condensin MukBEF complex kleisin-like MukF subunit
MKQNIKVARELVRLARELIAKQTPEEMADKAVKKITGIMTREWKKTLKNCREDFAARMSAELRDISQDALPAAPDEEFEQLYSQLAGIIAEKLKSAKIPDLDDEVVADMISVYLE